MMATLAWEGGETLGAAGDLAPQPTADEAAATTATIAAERMRSRCLTLIGSQYYRESAPALTSPRGTEA
jgi:hypothetical protein